MGEEALQKMIEEAFADVRYPGHDDITKCRCPECKEIAEYFRGTTWKGHTVKLLRYHESALSLFTSSAFHYWVPAFMLAVIEDPEEADVIADNLKYRLSRMEVHARDGHSLLSPEQQSVANAFLVWMESDEGYYAR